MFIRRRECLAQLRDSTEVDKLTKIKRLEEWEEKFFKRLLRSVLLLFENSKKIKWEGKFCG
jgi:hypothetical protein